MTVTMPETVVTIINAINLDPDLSAALTGGVYGYAIPKDKVPPLAVVTLEQDIPLSRPSTQWWSSMVTIDIHATDPIVSRNIAGLLATRLPQITGNTPGGVIAGCEVDSIQPVIDGDWTPTRYRQVVTVDVTARGPQEV